MFEDRIRCSGLPQHLHYRSCYSGVAKPSERTPQRPTFEESIEVSNADAVAEWRGINDSPQPSSTGSLEKKGGRRGDGRGAVAASPLSFGGPAEMECDDWLRSSSDFAELEDR